MKDNAIGKKIKKYRLRANMSQMELELAIESSFGSISRIEAGKVNPTKETLQKIIKTLDIRPFEASQLLGLDQEPYLHVLYASKEFMSSLILDKVLQNAVNIISKELKLLGVIIDIVKGDELWNATFTQSWYTDLMNKVMGKPHNSFFIKMKDYPDNIGVQCVTEQKVKKIKHVRDLGRGFLPLPVCDILNKIGGVKSGIAFPIISSGGQSLGVIYFGKNVEDDYESERYILQAFTDAVAIAIENAQKYEDLKKKVKIQEN